VRRELVCIEALKAEHADVIDTSTELLCSSATSTITQRRSVDVHVHVDVNVNVNVEAAPDVHTF
jgi:hypothetical protein